MIEWENGYKSKRYQPVRCDGARLTIECGLSGCVAYWGEGDITLRSPMVYRWRWFARLWERIGSWLYTRADLKRIRPVA